MSAQRKWQASSRQLTLTVLGSAPKQGTLCFRGGTKLLPASSYTLMRFYILMARMSRQIMMYLAPLALDQPQRAPISDPSLSPHSWRHLSPFLWTGSWRWERAQWASISHLTIILPATVFRFSNFRLTAAPVPTAVAVPVESPLS